ncbi:nuclear pore complex protein Nup160 homolog [Tribolium madens]|uniref:nuclear pore complex protein Nup160 homolog n=1 Tax=Tribolium madens TaxID=41895 RepID=UPI001CF73872|nr:nuclear pore complex protein Nup160 homolog [Tribolium madens]
MQEIALGYREVIPDQTVSDPWREITLNTGGTQGTLQDIKVAERANGFCYRDSTKPHTRNRFIYWRISHDVLELVEHSLDINLAGNRIRYKFVDTPILDGVSIHETYDNVVVLVPTVCSVHRLVFPHPDKYHRQDHVAGVHPDLAAPSVFSEATTNEARDPATFHFFTNSSSQLPFLADSSLTLAEEEAIFVLAYHSGEILLVRQSREGKIDSAELKSESIVPRFLSGLADKLRQKDKDGDTTVSLILHTFGLETFALTLCRNGHLKFWSCSRAECVSVIDVMAETGGNARNQPQGAQNHILRKAVDGFDSECLLGIFMSFAAQSQLHVFKPILSGSQIRLVRLNTLDLAQTDLIDFTLSTSRIWSVWRGKEGECEVYSASNQAGSHWIPVVLESVPDASQPLNIDGETDPRQSYLQHIFHPGRFPLHIISKALNIYKRSAIVGDVNISAAQLKQQICMAVEDEIQNELKETVVSDEDYLETGNYCWQQFYSCCVQYHVAGLKPLGLLVLPNSSGAVLLKKSMISFLRPLDIFEHFIYESDHMFKEQFTKYFLLTDNVDITDDVINLFKVINYLDSQMSDIFAYTFEKELALLKSPDVVMGALLEKIQREMDTEFTDYVAEMLRECTDLYQTIHKILELLRIEYQIQPEEPLDEVQTSLNHIFASQLGVSMVTGCLRQQIHVRFTICRSLLLITNILLERLELDWNVLEAIRSVCSPEIVVLTQANFVMVWLAGLSALQYLPTESALQRLSSLRLSPVFNLRTNAISSISLLELFAGSTGGYEARKAFARLRHNEESLANWHLALLPYLNCLFHIIWPISGSPILAEWLLSCGQHLWLQQYIRYIGTWCEWNSCTHSFLLAASLLTTGETYKAQELFQMAAKGIFTDHFLAQRIFTHDHNQTKAYINYYLKVIHLFELHKSYDCAINLANIALSVTSPDDPLAATLYSIKFKHHLVLKNYQMAYDSLNANPDSDRRKDNLRDLVKKLLDEKKLDVLMSFTYNGMEELFCDIVSTRARAADPSNNIYYDFLYAYQVKRGATFLRSAASVMYEQAFRLNQYNDSDSLEKQVKCFLAAKNALALCEPQYAYIVMPVDQIEDKVVSLPIFAASDEEPEEITLRKQVNIINLEILSKDLAFASAKLKLIRFNPRNYFEITNPHELVILLTSAGLFKTALTISKIFEVPYRIVFEALTKKCGSLSRQNEPVTWKWLIENNLQDLPMSTKGASEAAWSLLQECVEEYEEEKMSLIHKIVCRQIIKMNLWIPQWLLSSYKKRNPAELFRLLYTSGRLEEAAEIASEYMMAAMGYGKEYYGFAHAMQPTTPAVCLPVRGFITLINQLKLINTNDPEKPFLRECEHLSNVLETYLKTAQRTSIEMCKYHLSLAMN